tara:strand:+ start:298 stop:2052 length:1755 start_codon:yes stop_codon:yes gene_type:complete
MKDKRFKDSDTKNILEYFNKGEYHEAEKLAKSILLKESENLFCLKILGIIYSKLGKLNKALHIHEKLILINKNDSESYNNLGICYKNLNRTEESLSAFECAINLNPNFSDAYYNLSNILEKKGRKNESLDAIQKAVELGSNNPKVHSQFGIRLYNSNLLDEARLSFQNCIKLESKNAEHFFYLANTFHKLGMLDEAIANYIKVTELDKFHSSAYTILGHIYSQKGKINLAQQYAENAISINPDVGKTHFLLSLIKKYKNVDDIQLSQMETGYSNIKNNNADRCYFAFGLGKAYEDLGNYKDSYDYYINGNNLRKKQLNYSISNDTDFFERITSLQKRINKHILPPKNSTLKQTPIFIVGMPRSGTTIVEQIISSHSKVIAGGELKFISKLSNRILDEKDNFNNNSLTQFRESYLDNIKKISKKNNMITDKMPQNFRYIGLITAAFPEAKIIHVHREPSATCWGIFKQCFTLESEALGFAYCLDDIVKYYKLYLNLMRFFRDSVNHNIYDLDYESLVVNNEKETRNLLQYLNLEWEEACLSPDKNPRAVMTASNIQVREKIYQGSSNSWKNFQPFLNGVLDNIGK